jgi:hypothetical protein
MWSDGTFTLNLQEYDYGDGRWFNKEKGKKTKEMGWSQWALLSTHFSLLKSIYIVLHGFTHCEKLCKCIFLYLHFNNLDGIK